MYSDRASFEFPKFVSICRFLRYESNLPPEQANSAFTYMFDWWFFDAQNAKEPDINTISKPTIELLEKNTPFFEVISALKAMRYEIPNNQKPTSDFEKYALIIGIPEQEIPLYNPYSDQYDMLAELGLDMDNIKGKAELAREKAETARLEEVLKRVTTEGKERIVEAAKKYIAVGGNPADVIEDWEEVCRKFNITPKDLE